MSTDRTPFDPKWIRNPSDELAIAEGCYFDEAAGNRVCYFIETFCCQSKGEWAGRPIRLIDWQRDMLMRAFGWKKANGKRRFRSVYVELPKKNGKSTLVSSVANFLVVGDEEPAAEVYLNATSKKQADIVFEEACRMVEKSPDLSDVMRVSRFYGTITCPETYGKIQKNSADAPSADGVNASGIIFDEIHRFKTRAQWDVFKYAGISRSQPIRIVITTAGESHEGVWHEQRQFSEGVNAGTIQNTTHLGIVYRARTAADGEADDLDDPETWKRANPSMGYTMSVEDFANEFRDAKAQGASELANFLRLRLGIVVRAQGKFIDMAAWAACGGIPEPRLDDPCCMGLDLSDRDDLSALVLVTGDLDYGFDVQCRFWLPEEYIAELEQQHGQPYRMWAEMGFIHLTQGKAVDRKFIRKAVVELATPRRLGKILIDPWNARDLAEDLLNEDGLPVEYLPQHFRHLSDPTKTLRELIKAGKIRHGNHPILTWHAANAVERRDPEGNIKLDKKLSHKKIDGMSALVNAIAGAIAGGGDASRSVYESGGVFLL